MLSISTLQPPRHKYTKALGPLAACSYVNSYVANGAVIAPCFGDPQRDEAAIAALAKAFPDRKIETLRIDHLASGGGGIRCLAQPMPK